MLLPEFVRLYDDHKYGRTASPANAPFHSESSGHFDHLPHPVSMARAALHPLEMLWASSWVTIAHSAEEDCVRVSEPLL